MIRSTAAWLLLGLFLLPLIILVFSFQIGLHINWNSFLGSLSFTFLQALASATITIFISMFLSLGFLRPTPKWLQVMAVAPNFLPAIIIISSLVSLLSRVYEFPYGFWGIVVVHSTVNVGFIALALAARAKRDLPNLSAAARVLGARPGHFVFSIYLPLLKQEAIQLFVFVFVVCFFSFATPLMVGGPGVSTLEVLIYESIKIEQDWSQALAISLLQIGLCFFFVYLLGKIKLVTAGNHSNDISKMAWLNVNLFKYLTLTLSFASLSGLFYFSLDRVKPFLDNLDFTNSLLQAGLASLQLSLLAAVCTAGILCLVALASGHAWFDRFLFSYSLPSTVLLGFALLLAGGNQQWLLEIKYVLGVSVLFAPIFYRLFLRSDLQRVRKYLQVAEVIGAGELKAFVSMTWPFVKRGLLLSSLFSALWVCGDFALASIVFDSQYTLALVVKALLGSYRLDLAIFSLWVLILFMLVILVLFLGVKVVTGQKSGQNMA